MHTGWAWGGGHVAFTASFPLLKSTFWVVACPGFFSQLKCTAWDMSIKLFSIDGWSLIWMLQKIKTTKGKSVYMYTKLFTYGQCPMLYLYERKRYLIWMHGAIFGNFGDIYKAGEQCSILIKRKERYSIIKENIWKLNKLVDYIRYILTMYY